MTTIYLSLNAQVAKITVFMKSPVQYWDQNLESHLTLSGDLSAKSRT